MAPTQFERFTNHLRNITKNNKNLIFRVLPRTKWVTLAYGNRNTVNNYSFVKFTPLNNHGVIVLHGRTGKNRRQKGEHDDLVEIYRKSLHELMFR